MSFYGSDLDNQPLRYYNGKPIYLTLLLTLGFAVGIVAVMIMASAGLQALVSALMFHPGAFLRGWVWQPLTYIFVNELNFFTPLSLVFFYMWGVEIEKYLGRRYFVAMCLGLTLLPVLWLLLFSTVGNFGPLNGNFFLVSGLLIAYATLYPDVEVWGWIPLKWFAFACIVCGSLTFFPTGQWNRLFLLWANCGLAFLLVRQRRGMLDFDWKAWLPKKKPKLRVLPHPNEQRSVRSRPTASSGAARTDDPETEIDALLDKIASQGLQSLTEAEKSRLETLRQRMMKKGS